MNILSLCDGISCGQIALKKANIKINKYFASEIDKNAIKVTQSNFPKTIQLGDITKINKEQLKQLPKIDLILCGSPCQGFSRNGKCLNFNDKRSKLFFEFVRILNWIKESNNPNIKFLFENVEMKKEWRDIISEYLKVDYILINSKVVSAQNRPRLYWSNIENITIPNDKNIKLLDILDININTEKYIHKNGLLIDSNINSNSINIVNKVNNEVRILQATKKGYIVANNGDGLNLGFPKSKTRRGRVIKQKSSTLDCGCDICCIHGNIIRKLNINELERLQTLPLGYTSCLTSESARKKCIGNGWTVDIISYILNELN